MDEKSKALNKLRLFINLFTMDCPNSFRTYLYFSATTKNKFVYHPCGKKDKLLPTSVEMDGFIFLRAAEKCLLATSLLSAAPSEDWPGEEELWMTSLMSSLPAKYTS